MTEIEAIVAERALWNRQHMQECQEKRRKLALDYEALFAYLTSPAPREEANG